MCCPSFLRTSPLLLQLLHPVKGRACLEPFYLCLIESMVQLNSFLAAITVLEYSMQRLEVKDTQTHTHTESE